MPLAVTMWDIRQVEVALGCWYDKVGNPRAIVGLDVRAVLLG